jgi:hypothetical protein
MYLPASTTTSYQDFILRTAALIRKRADGETLPGLCTVAFRKRFFLIPIGRPMHVAGGRITLEGKFK